MKKFVINLEKREDRKEAFENTNSFLTDYKMVKAFDAADLNIVDLVNMGFDTNRLWRDPFHNRKMTRGEIGCFISHYMLWDYCAKNDEPIMIFEDDAIIDQNLWDENYYEDLATTYDMVYFGHNDTKPDEAVEVNDNLIVPGYAYNMHAYMITPSGAKKLLSTGIHKQIIPVDDFTAILRKQIHVVALKKSVAIQQTREQFGTDVEPVSEDDWFIDFRVHPLTVGTDRKKCIPLNDSGARHGIYPQNLGTNVDWHNDMSGPSGGIKVNLLKKTIKDLPDHDVVLFTDAYDVFYADDAATITKRYIGFNTKVLFAAEADIWPDTSLAEQFPDGGTKYRYLNSGLFMAQVGELKKILLNEEISNDDDDQLFYQKQFLSNQYDWKLDYEGYIFTCHEPRASKNGTQLYNPETNTFSCIYHGNGGDEAKNKFDALYRMFFPKLPTLYLPAYKKFDLLDRDMMVIDFMTQSQCEDLITIADKHGNWESLKYDKFPAQEIRMKELGLWEELEKHWQKHIYPIVEEYWHPMEMYGLRDAFVMRYATDTQTSLPCHHDASLVTGSVKLNDDYEGADLFYKRQNISNKVVPVGRCILFPGQVTHAHECNELISGVKYSLTMWTKRHWDDEI
jgi:GR25 family glycosyltransferase involved in LPS biosynthesis